MENLKFLINLLFIFCIINISACSDSTGNQHFNQDEEVNDDVEYPNGIYCAEVEYYYPKTGTNSIYTLKVEIENELLVKILWPNGGWLDDSHFSSPNIADGSAIFESDEGVEYAITILGHGDDCNYSSFAPSEDDFIEENEDEICPQCERKKYSWDDLCRRCEDKNENTCSKCGEYEFFVNGGLCDNCKRKRNEDYN